MSKIARNVKAPSGIVPTRIRRHGIEGVDKPEFGLTTYEKHFYKRNTRLDFEHVPNDPGLAQTGTIN